MRVILHGFCGLLAAIAPHAAQAVPAEVENVRFCAGAAKNCLQWSGVSGAVTYAVYTGDFGTEACLLSSNTDSCRLLVTDQTSTGATVAGTPGSGKFFWYLVTAKNASGEGSAGSTTFGQRVRDGATECGTCARTGGNCTQNACCSGTCDGFQQCSSSCPMPPGSTCAQDAECFNGICEAGSCCTFDSLACTTSSQCCSGAACMDGSCCVTQGGSCSARFCCAGLTCIAGSVCGVCTPTGGGCTGTGFACCSGVCDFGHCR